MPRDDRWPRKARVMPASPQSIPEKGRRGGYPPKAVRGNSRRSTALPTLCVA
jgi:hypothetical protein